MEAVLRVRFTEVRGYIKNTTIIFLNLMSLLKSLINQ